MKRRILLGMAGAAILVLGGAPAASAQAQPDTAVLVRAVTSFLADSVMPRLGGCNPLFVRTAETAFDTATAAVLLETVPSAEAFGPRPPPAYEWVRTRGFTMRGDTAAVMVEVGSTSPQPGEDIDTYIEQHLYLFVPDASGWRYVRRRLMRGMHLGEPRRG